MPAEEQLDINERYKVLRLYRAQYSQAKRARRSQILDELEQLTGLDRKTLIRHMHGPCVRQRRRKQRGRTYGGLVDDALRLIAEAHDFICAERLHPNLLAMARHLAAHHELTLSVELEAQLAQISLSSVRRILQRLGRDEPRLKRRAGKATAYQQAVPMRRISWAEQEPGHLEVDLVHHCGRETSGEYVYTLHLVDVTTGWSEAVAVLGRSALVMEDGFRRALSRLPFAVREIHTDNGSEFFTAHLARFFREQLQAQRSRSRPYRKNDARMVEQRNGDLIRSYIGHERLDTAAQTNQLNRVYELLSRYHNYAQPCLRLESKTLSADGARVQRTFSAAQTPFERLTALAGIADEPRQQLAQQWAATNPRQLRRQFGQSLDALFALPNASPAQSEDVYQTLFLPPTPEKEANGQK